MTKYDNWVGKILKIILPLLLSLGVVMCKRSASNGLPNIVLIIVGSLRPDHLGCYGFPQDMSPEIDRIAREGVLFGNAFAQSSWTRPSIGSMLTSLYPRILGLSDEKFDQLAGRSKSFLKSSKTGAIRQSALRPILTRTVFLISSRDLINMSTAR